MQSIINWLLPPKKTPHVLTERDLIRQESEVGSALFGEVPINRERDFFCLDANTWIWHENWFDSNSNKHSITTKYEIHSNMVLKTQNGENAQAVEGVELQNLAEATRQYYLKVAESVYNRPIR